MDPVPQKAKDITKISYKKSIVLSSMKNRLTITDNTFKQEKYH
jgi:hypothetical protein